MTASPTAALPAFLLEIFHHLHPFVSLTKSLTIAIFLQQSFSTASLMLRTHTLVRVCFFSPRMPELPDITAYLTALAPRVVDQPLEQLRIASPLLLRTAIPPIHSIEGKPI